ALPQIRDALAQTGIKLESTPIITQPLDLSRLSQPNGEQPLIQHIRQIIDSGQARAEIKLDPPNLGTLDIRQTQTNGIQQVQISAPNPVAREILNAVQPQLSTALAQNGVELTVSRTDESSAPISDRTTPSEIATESTATPTLSRQALGIAPDPTTASGRFQPLILERLLQPGGEQRLAEQLRWSLERGLESAEIKLHPPSLGALDVRFVQEGDRTHVQFVAAHPATREALEAALPRLRDALAQDGVWLGNVSVSDQAPNERGETGRERREPTWRDEVDAADTEHAGQTAAESDTEQPRAHRLDVFS
ncbi:hook-length control protein FliK, partial [Allochromatium warmingii]